VEDKILYHYGTKGMKWGVRRAIGKASREAARVERFKKGTTWALIRRERKLEKYEKKGRDTKRIKEKIKSGQVMVNKYEKRYNELTKGMSQRDIARGRVGAIGRTVLAGMLLGPVGAITVETVLTTKANIRSNPK
jgi:hypothetical protein